MIYMDNAATTGVDRRVMKAMEPFWHEQYANPSASYSFSAPAAEAIKDARTTIAAAINANEDEIFFTSGGSESDNWAVKGIFAQAMTKSRRAHFVSQPTEHKAILKSLEYVGSRGATVSMIPVNSDGQISLDVLDRELFEHKTDLVTIMYVNNETGTIQNVDEIASICDKHRVPFHTDAVQAFLHTRINLFKQRIGMLSASGHKIGAPKGIGFLYIRKNLQPLMAPLISGGQQENGFRAGTENVAGIVGMGEAVRLFIRYANENRKKVQLLHDHFVRMLKQNFPKLLFNGMNAPMHSDYHINVCFAPYGIDGSQLLAFFDQYGVCVSSGSACNSASQEPSYVLKAMGRTDKEAESSIRFSINENNTVDDINTVIRMLEVAVECLGH